MKRANDPTEEKDERAKGKRDGHLRLGELFKEGERVLSRKEITKLQQSESCEGHASLESSLRDDPFSSSFDSSKYRVA